MKNRLAPQKIIALFLCTVLFATHVAFAHLPETSLWSERRTGSSPWNAAIEGPRSVGTLCPDVSRSRMNGLFVGAMDLSSLNPFVTVRKVLKPAGHSKSVVLHIQDIHGNQEAQLNISRALQKLNEQKKIDMVALEGAYRIFDLSVFRQFPRPNTIRAVANYLLREKRISGPIHAMMTSPVVGVSVIGVDDANHYAANVQAVRDASSQKDNVQHVQSVQRIKLDSEKRKLFNAALLDFDRAVEAYRSEKLPFASYVKLLATGRSDVSPAVRDYLEVLRIEANINFSQVEIERDLLVAQIVSRNRVIAEQLHKMAFAFRAQQIDHEAFYLWLRDAARKSHVPIENFLVFKEYLRYVLLSDRIDVEAVLAEARQLEQQRFRWLVKTADERRLVDASKRLYLESKLVDFSLTKREWEEYEELIPHPALPTDKAWGGKLFFTNPKTSGGVLPLHVSSMGRVGWGIDAVNLSPFEQFYRQAELRDGAMANNFLNAQRSINNLPRTTSVLITGGFHSSGIDDALTKAGCTVVSIVPRVTSADASKASAYLSVFAQEKSPLEKLFEGQKLFLANDPMAPLIQFVEAPVEVALFEAANALSAGTETMLPLPADATLKIDRAGVGSAQGVLTRGVSVVPVELRANPNEILEMTDRSVSPSVARRAIGGVRRFFHWLLRKCGFVYADENAEWTSNLHLYEAGQLLLQRGAVGDVRGSSNNVGFVGMMPFNPFAVWYEEASERAEQGHRVWLPYVIAAMGGVFEELVIRNLLQFGILEACFGMSAWWSAFVYASLFATVLHSKIYTAESPTAVGVNYLLGWQRWILFALAVGLGSTGDLEVITLGHAFFNPLMRYIGGPLGMMTEPNNKKRAKPFDPDASILYTMHLFNHLDSEYRKLWNAPEPEMKNPMYARPGQRLFVKENLSVAERTQIDDLVDTLMKGQRGVPGAKPFRYMTTAEHLLIGKALRSNLRGEGAASNNLTEPQREFLRNLLVMWNMANFWTLTRKIPARSRNEVFQNVLLYVLRRIIYKYDYHKGLNFNTLAGWAATQEVSVHYREKHKLAVTKRVTAKDPDAFWEMQPEREKRSDDGLIEKLLKVLGRLSPKEEKALRLRYGLMNTKKGKSFAELAATLNMTVWAVQDFVDVAYAHLEREFARLEDFRFRHTDENIVRDLSPLEHRVLKLAYQSHAVFDDADIATLLNSKIRSNRPKLTPLQVKKIRKRVEYRILHGRFPPNPFGPPHSVFHNMMMLLGVPSSHMLKIVALFSIPLESGIIFLGLFAFEHSFWLQLLYMIGAGVLDFCIGYLGYKTSGSSLPITRLLIAHHFFVIAMYLCGWRLLARSEHDVLIFTVIASIHMLIDAVILWWQNIRNWFSSEPRLTDDPGTAEFHMDAMRDRDRVVINGLPDNHPVVRNQRNYEGKEFISEHRMNQNVESLPEGDLEKQEWLTAKIPLQKQAAAQFKKVVDAIPSVVPIVYSELARNFSEARATEAFARKAAEIQKRLLEDVAVVGVFTERRLMIPQLYPSRYRFGRLRMSRDQSVLYVPMQLFAEMRSPVEIEHFAFSFIFGLEWLDKYKRVKAEGKDSRRIHLAMHKLEERWNAKEKNFVNIRFRLRHFVDYLNYQFDYVRSYFKIGAEFRQLEAKYADITKELEQVVSRKKFRTVAHGGMDINRDLTAVRFFENRSTISRAQSDVERLVDKAELVGLFEIARKMILFGNYLYICETGINPALRTVPNIRLLARTRGYRQLIRLLRALKDRHIPFELGHRGWLSFVLPGPRDITYVPIGWGEVEMLLASTEKLLKSIFERQMEIIHKRSNYDIIAANWEIVQAALKEVREMCKQAIEAHDALEANLHRVANALLWIAGQLKPNETPRISDLKRLRLSVDNVALDIPLKDWFPFLTEKEFVSVLRDEKARTNFRLPSEKQVKELIRLFRFLGTPNLELKNLIGDVVLVVKDERDVQTVIDNFDDLNSAQLDSLTIIARNKKVKNLLERRFLETGIRDQEIIQADPSLFSIQSPSPEERINIALVPKYFEGTPVNINRMTLVFFSSTKMRFAEISDKDELNFARMAMFFPAADSERLGQRDHGPFFKVMEISQERALQQVVQIISKPKTKEHPRLGLMWFMPSTWGYAIASHEARAGRMPVAISYAFAAFGGLMEEILIRRTVQTLVFHVPFGTPDVFVFAVVYALLFAVVFHQWVVDEQTGQFRRATFEEKSYFFLLALTIGLFGGAASSFEAMGWLHALINALIASSSPSRNTELTGTPLNLGVKYIDARHPTPQPPFDRAQREREIARRAFVPESRRYFQNYRPRLAALRSS